jgi:endo-1,4-beta-xylanase
MKKLYSIGIAFTMIAIMLITGCRKQEKKSNLTLKKGFENCFFIGTAMNVPQISGVDTSSLIVIKKHFNAVVAENCMKSDIIHPQENTFDFDLSDKFVAFGEANDMFITGHTLIWHSQVAPWFFVDEKGNDVSKEVLIERMRNHIHTIVGRYKDRIRGWDVVNEAILDDGSWRKSKFYTIIGEEFVKLAFQFAHEADPNAELYYNDYSMTMPGRREAVVQLVKSLKAKDLRIDAIGMQGHCSMKNPSLEDFEESIKIYSEENVKVMITELDITSIPNPFELQGADVANRFDYSEEMDPYKDGLTEEARSALDKRYLDFFKVCLKHKDKISRVTVWGVNDSQSWRNNWPIEGRTDYPLLFDRQNKAKPIVKDIIDEASNIK